MIRFPEHQDPRLVPALGALRAGRWGQARRVYEGVLASSPDLAEAHFGLAYTLMRMREIVRAAEHARRAVELEGNDAHHRYALATILRAAGDLDGAIEAFRDTLDVDPALADCRIDLATSLEQIGRLGDADRTLTTLLASSPDDQRARAALVRVRLRAGEPDAAQLAEWRRTLDEIAADPEDPLVASEANDVLVDVCERQSDHPAAFGAMRRMNDAEARRHPGTLPAAHREPFLAMVSQQTAGLYTSVTQRWKNLCPDDGLPSPTLLVGFPRSGTTMTERALDAHPGLVSIEERPTFEQTKAHCLQGLGPDALQRPIVEVLDALTPPQVSALRAFYWSRVAEALGGATPEGTVVLDKLPLRIMELSFVNRVFPEARVLVAIRDPRDVCLSCFRQRFDLNRVMSFFVEPEGAARLYRAVMSGWVGARAVYSFPWKEIRYEDTVEAFEDRVREMLVFLGLRWDDAVLRFHERPVERASTTPSYHAVRRPVGTGAVGRWKGYAAELAPILPIVEPLVEAFGYEPSPGAGSA
jgi:Flp pilus assembly protein TadD